MKYDNTRKMLTAKRLKECRLKRGLSHDKLARALRKKYSLEISSAALKNYEIDEEIHTKFDAGFGMNIRYLFTLADFYEVSTDYLLGIDDAPTREISDVCKVTPLAPEPVTILGLINNDQKKWKALRDNGLSKDTRMSMNDFRAKALNHLIANCSEVLVFVGLYLFSDFTGTENVSVKNEAINITAEFVRSGFLPRITTILENYRQQLLDNGGDLPLSLGLDAMREEFQAKQLKLLKEKDGESNG